MNQCPACLGTGAVVARAAIFPPSSLLRCSSCGTERLRPQPSNLRLAEIYGPNYYAPWTTEDAKTVDMIKRATFSPMLEACAITRGTIVLDLGCATGSFLAEASRRGALAYGIDLSQRAIEQARQRVPEASLHVGFAADQPFPGVSFDAVAMIDFIEHVRDPEAELQIVAERMRPGSKLVISTPRVDSMVRRAMGRHWPQYREEHLTYFSRAGLAALLDRVGFTIERVSPTRKALTLAYACGQAVAYPVPVLTPLTKSAYRFLPGLRHRQIKLSLGEMTVVACRRP
jgi:2-polyprenyl-3-methyl-5-hydroxy-6-metoxy-1,4-benzoquinol methylase